MARAEGDHGGGGGDGGQSENLHESAPVCLCRPSGFPDAAPSSPRGCKRFVSACLLDAQTRRSGLSARWRSSQVASALARPLSSWLPNGRWIYPVTRVAGLWRSDPREDARHKLGDGRCGGGNEPLC